MAAHWFCLVPLVPFLVMFALHRVLGLSEAMGGVLVGERPPSTAEIAYNYAMVFGFYIGVVGYFVFAAARAVIDWQGGTPPQPGSRSRSFVLGTLLFIAKIALLGACWYVLVVTWGQ